MNVVEEVLAARVVHQHDGESKLAGLGSGARAQDAGGGFFTGSEHLVRVGTARLMEQLDQIAAVVDHQMRAQLQRHAHMVAHLLGLRAMTRVDV